MGGFQADAHSFGFETGLDDVEMVGVGRRRWVQWWSNAGVVVTGGVAVINHSCSV